MEDDEYLSAPCAKCDEEVRYCECTDCDCPVSCDKNCGAKRNPQTFEEYKAALGHWRGHGYLHGCSHGC